MGLISIVPTKLGAVDVPQKERFLAMNIPNSLETKNEIRLQTSNKYSLEQDFQVIGEFYQQKDNIESLSYHREDKGIIEPSSFEGYPQLWKDVRDFKASYDEATFKSEQILKLTAKGWVYDPKVNGFRKSKAVFYDNSETNELDGIMIESKGLFKYTREPITLLEKVKGHYKIAFMMVPKREGLIRSAANYAEYRATQEA